MSNLPALTGKQIIHILEKLGFVEIRVWGSHHFMRHPDGRSTVVSSHASETIGRGLKLLTQKFSAVTEADKRKIIETRDLGRLDQAIGLI